MTSTAQNRPHGRTQREALSRFIGDEDRSDQRPANPKNTLAFETVVLNQDTPRGSIIARSKLQSSSQGPYLRM
jgi:hypothetical protein